MLQLENKTPFAANLTVFPDEDGRDTLYVMARATFKMGAKWTLVDEQPMPVEVDGYYGEPGESSVQYPSEYHLGKLASDIIVLGSAFAPKKQEVRALDVSVTVGEVSKTIKVFGDRIWQNGLPGQPQPFLSMPITYEKAFGGVCKSEDGQVISGEERNPVGVGFLGEYFEEDMDGALLPNIEYPDRLIQSLRDEPEPAGFGAIAPNWKPRMNYAGTYDDTWQETRMPYLPVDFDKQFFNVGSPGLVYPGYLRGGELVSISNMHPDGDLQFQLPAIHLMARTRIGNQVLPLSFNLETLILEPNDLKVSLNWRASILCGKAISKVVGVEMVMARQKAA